MVACDSGNTDQLWERVPATGGYNLLPKRAQSNDPVSPNCLAAYGSVSKVAETATGTYPYVVLITVLPRLLNMPLLDNAFE